LCVACSQEEALEERRLTAQQVRQQAQDEARQRSEQAAVEAAERRDIIAQLRGLEKAARARNNGLGGASRGKVFDATAVSRLLNRFAWMDG
jgi:multidrug efflux pump subunit AcrA (membrane-fusion protein)